VKMAGLFSNSEYILIVLAHGETCGSVPRAQRISFLWGTYMNNNYSQQQRNAGKSGRIISSAPSLLTITVVTLNTLTGTKNDSLRDSL
jgi:hypothetical protein